MHTSRISLLLVAFTLIAADWSHWRGNSRDGLTTESSGYTNGKWFADKPAWSLNVGEGATSPLIVKDRLYVTGHAGGQDTLWCVDVKTGKEIWKVAGKTARYGRYHLGDEVFYAGPCSTPEYDPDTGYIYTLSIDGDLVCRDTSKKGSLVWEFNLYDRHGAKRRPKVGRGGAQRDYGYTSAPLIYRDWLLVEVGGKEGNLVAYDKRTGKMHWASQNKDLAGHNGGPALMTVEGIPCVAVLTLYNLVVSRLDKGHEGHTLGTYSWATEFGNNIASPCVHEDCVLITSAYNKKAICKLRATKTGLSKVWETPYPSKACTPVVHKGYVYLAWTKIRCLDYATGKQIWEGSHIGDPGSCVVTSDDRLIVWGHNGRLILADTAKRSPKEYRELARFERVFNTHAWPHVVVGSGHVICKDRRGNVKAYRLIAD